MTYATFLSELMFLYLDDKAPPSEVINKVAAVVSQSGNAAGQELYSLLESSDIERYVPLCFSLCAQMSLNLFHVNVY